MTCYVFFKDFAGPIATICAAAAAVFVTIHFNRKQMQIAETQKNIALDKLKWDSHEERYTIYSDRCKNEFMCLPPIASIVLRSSKG
jgi:hypothetical protein